MPCFAKSYNQNMLSATHCHPSLPRLFADQILTALTLNLLLIIFPVKRNRPEFLIPAYFFFLHLGGWPQNFSVFLYRFFCLQIHRYSGLRIIPLNRHSFCYAIFIDCRNHFLIKCNFSKFVK